MADTKTGIGASVRRKEDLRFITGKGNYTDDINLKDQTFAYFLRSPHPHAKIKSINSAKARKMEGVVGIFTGEDVAKDKLGGLICGWMIHSKDGSPMKAGPHPVLAQDKVRFVGDQVALVVAETKEQARAAAQAIVVTYETLPHVVDVAKAMKSKAQVHDVAPDNRVFNWSLGNEADTNAAFAKASHVTSMDIVNNRLIPNAMEPRAAIGSYDTGTESYTLYTTSQNPHVARLVISAFHGLAPEHKLRVIAPDVGGGFGSKIFIYGEEVACVWASKFIGGRPIKWTGERSESFLCDAHGRDHVLDKDDIPGLFEVVFMSFLSSVILITVAALGAMGFAGLLPERMFTRRAKRLVRRPLTPPPAPAPDVSREGKEPPRPSGPLTGNDLEDYYSGAIKAHARGYWSGFWCDIFLLEDRVVVVHDESHHHWVRSFTIREALAPEVVNDLFVDNGQYPPNAEVTRTRKDYEATLTRN